MRRLGVDNVAKDFDASLVVDAMLDPRHPVKVQASEWARANVPTRGTAFDRDRWRAAAEFGILALKTPRSFGGRGASTTEALLTFEGLGHGAADGGFVFALASQVFATQTALCESGSPSQQARWLPSLSRGEALGAFAMSEPDAGSDIASISTTATEQPDGTFVLDGVKAWVTLGPLADVVIVFATTDRERGRWGITAFLVPTDTPGFERGPIEVKSGLASCPFGQVRLAGCRVPADALLGPRGAGAAVFSSAVEAERAFLYAAQVGVMERHLERAVERARSRTQFGKPIGSFQAVSHRIAEMKLRHEMARLLIYKAAALHDRGESVTMAAALAKLHTSEAAVEGALDVVRIHGAEGYTEAAGLELELRDAVGGLAYSGTSDIQRNIIAGLLGVDRPARPRPLQKVPS